MKIHCVITETGSVVLSEEEQEKLRVFSGQHCVLSLDFEEKSDVQRIASIQSLEEDVVRAGLAQEGAWNCNPNS